MADEQPPREPAGEAGGPEELQQDSFVERFRGDPSQPPQPVRVLEGLLGNSDREGYLRIYFTREFDSYAEFRAEDYVYREPIPADQPPFIGLDASRVAIKRDAPIWYTQVRVPRPVDEFDLDIRLAGLGPSGGAALPITAHICTDGTCRTDCNQATCETCRTQCGQATCHTCQTQCNTCHTDCGTCPGDTCSACTHIFTQCFGPQCRPQ